MDKGGLIIDNPEYAQPESVSVGFGDAAKDLESTFMKTAKHYYTPVSRTTDVDKFDMLALTWGVDNRFNSNAQEIAQHPAYMQIIGMGKEALPFIFHRMKQEPGHWFIALQALTGVNPVKPENRGRILAMTDDWLEWGSKNGFDV